MYIDESAVYNSEAANSLVPILELKELNSQTEPLLEPIWARATLNQNGSMTPQSLTTLSSNVLIGCAPIPALIR